MYAEEDVEVTYDDAPVQETRQRGSRRNEISPALAEMFERQRQEIIAANPDLLAPDGTPLPGAVEAVRSGKGGGSGVSLALKLDFAVILLALVFLCVALYVNHGFNVASVAVRWLHAALDPGLPPLSSPLQPPPPA